MFRDNLDDYEARKDASKQAPAPVDAGLVERMLIAWAHGNGDIKLDAINVLRMTAVLRVAAGALLAPVTAAEANDWSRDEWGVRYLYQNGVNELFAARRARLLAPESKPDAAVGAVQAAGDRNGIAIYSATAREIVAAVDRARGRP